jgi:monoamine oxidase
MTLSLNRRQFLLASGAAMIGAGRARSQNGPRRVLIAGAGLTGLSAAYQLAKAGYQVSVIEARARHGGRVFTLRDQFADGLYVETGGEVAGDGYKRFLAYCREFNVAVDEVVGGESRAMATMMRGRIYQPGEAIDPHPYGLVGEEALPPPQLLAKHLRAMGEEAAANPAKLAEFDKLSLEDALKARGVSLQAISLMNVSLNYNGIGTVSAAGALWENRRRASGGTKAMRVRGGNSRLTDALSTAASRAGVQFIYGAAVLRVAHSSKGVLVWAKDAESLASLQERDRYWFYNELPPPLEADHFISTLPATTLRDIHFQPALPREKWSAISELPYTRVTKIWLQARRAAWDEAGYGAGLWTDTLLERVLALPGDPKATRGVFVVWQDGAPRSLPDHRSLDHIDHSQRMQWVRKTLADELPRFAPAIEGGASVAWATDPWARGAYAHFATGQLMSLRPHLATPIGRLHFAGEHTAENSPGMEGALESADRVVAEIKGQ